VNPVSERRVLLHVGTPKTGTSHLQDVLFRNRLPLQAARISYPGQRFDSHFLGALDLMRMPWGGLEKEAVGAWARLAGSARSWSGTTIISHEILAGATPEQIARARESLGDAEVHIVVSARDLARQIPAEWQENIKHRHVLKYSSFIARIQDPERASRTAAWFWNVQELPAILDRWSEGIPPERIHLITVPPSGAARDLLWQRFSTAFGLDEVALEATSERLNPSLGVPETALIRKINRRFNRVIEPADYRPLVRELLAHRTLSGRTDSPRLALPPDVHPWARELNQAWVDEIRARGYDVIGDLDDLLGAEPAEDYVDPDRLRPRMVNSAALDAIGALLEENVRLRRSEITLQSAVVAARKEAKPGRKAAELVVRGLEDSGPGRSVLNLYRRARGRSSRSA